MARGTHARRYPWLRLALTFVLALGVLAALPPATVRAATFTVLNGDDDGPGSLWQTVSNAPAGSTINFAPGVTTVTLTTAPIELAKNVTIQGSGVGGVTVQRADGISDFSVFTVDPGVVATVQGLTIRNGNTVGSGGGVRNEGGALTLIDSVITGNTANNRGGGIANIGTAATVAVQYSTISGNTASIGGGGLYNEGTATLTSSTVSGNLVTNGTGIGGGLYNNGGGTTAALTVTSSTISGNTATGGGGGGLYNQSATATLTNSTVSGNAANTGGGLHNDRGVATLNAVTLVSNSATGAGGGISAFGQSGSVADTTFGRGIVAGNTSPNDADCSTNSIPFAPFASTGYNLFGAGSNCPAIGPGDSTYAGTLNALLNPTLANNGGPTKTHALVLGSPRSTRCPPPSASSPAISAPSRAPRARPATAGPTRPVTTTSPPVPVALARLVPPPATTRRAASSR